MAYMRTNKRETHFVQMDKEPINDENLSFKATGILLYVLSKPDSWKINMTDLTRRKKEKETAVRSGIKELINAGYIFRHRERNEDGTFGEYIYDVFERPEYNHFINKPDPKRENQVQAPKRENRSLVLKGAKRVKSAFSPKREKPTQEKPTQENHAYSNNDFSNNDFSNNDLSLKDIERERKKINDIRAREIDPRFISLLHERLEELIENKVDIKSVGQWLGKRKTAEIPAYIKAFVINQLADYPAEINNTANFIMSTLNMAPELLKQQAKAAAEHKQKEYKQRIKQAAGAETIKRPNYNWLEN